ncbi:MAG: PadR family transcriptional regulator [Acidimicrobiales bacterium]
MNNVKLTPTAHAVLGLLSFGQPLAGYEIRQWARRALGHFYPAPAQSQIYAELSRLEEAGFVSSSDVPQVDRPDKITFTITPAGTDQLSDWIATAPIPAPVLKHHLALRVFLGHNGDPTDLIPSLEAHRDSLLALLDELETQSVAMGAEPDAGYAAAVADWTAEIYRGDLRGVDHVLKALTS